MTEQALLMREVHFALRLFAQGLARRGGRRGCGSQVGGTGPKDEINVFSPAAHTWSTSLTSELTERGRERGIGRQMFHVD